MTRIQYLFALGAAVAAACFVGIFVPVPARAAALTADALGSPKIVHYCAAVAGVMLLAGLCTYLVSMIRFKIGGGIAGVVLCFLALPALAQTEIAQVDGTTLKLSWEAMVAALGPSIASFAVTVFTGLGSILMARVAPVWISSLLQSRLETTVQTAVDYALNATKDAAKGKTLTVPVASAVVANGLQRIVDSTSPWLIRRVKGGLPELGNRIFRKLDIEESATAANVVAPAIQNLPDLAARG